MRRWVNVRTPGHEDYRQPDYSDAHIQSLDIRTGRSRWDSRTGHTVRLADRLNSYGDHFPLVEALTTRSGRTRLWLLNGDRWGGSGGWGVSTSSQQIEVRGLTRATGIETIILPFSAIDAARIEHESITVLAQNEEQWVTEEFRDYSAFPSDARNKPAHEMIDGTGYGHSYDSISDIPEDIRAYFDSSGRVLPLYEESYSTRVSFGRRHRDYSADNPRRDYATGNIQPRTQWQPSESGRYLEQVTVGYWVPPVYRYIGTEVYGTHGKYFASDDGSYYYQNRQRHILGESVFRAAYRGTNGKRYFANFLSGVDSDPHGSGYFLVQLPKHARTDSVEAAYESLKPHSVQLAEKDGIEVKRQGDIYAIPTNYSLRDLRKLGADIRQSKLASEERRAAIREYWEREFTTALQNVGLPVHVWEIRNLPSTDYRRRNWEEMRRYYAQMQRNAITEFDATHRIHTQRDIYGTRHYATEIAILPNGVTLARGTVRHSGGDHRMLTLGNVWHVMARNNVPLAR